MRTITAKQMQSLDAEAIENLGIPRLLLMEHAGAALSRAVLELDSRGPAAICCGKGYNGGDGLAAARHLHNAGMPVRVLLLNPLEDLREEPLCFARILERLGVPLASYDGPASVERWLRGARIIVDALLGIGLRDPVREPVAQLIRGINASGLPVVSADVPSGMDADTGEALGAAVRAAATVTFGLAKAGCLTQAGRSLAGRLIVDPITFPPALLEASQSAKEVPPHGC